jgi:hypothetical protein
VRRAGHILRPLILHNRGHLFSKLPKTEWGYWLQRFAKSRWIAHRSNFDFAPRTPVSHPRLRAAVNLTTCIQPDSFLLAVAPKERNSVGARALPMPTLPVTPHRVKRLSRTLNIVKLWLLTDGHWSIEIELPCAIASTMFLRAFSVELRHARIAFTRAHAALHFVSHQ